jgi:uncharacterized RDD family membrane protein YckC
LFGEAEDSGAPVREGVGFGRRALARVIDFIVHSLVGLFTGMGTGIIVAVGALVRGVPPEPAIAHLDTETALGFAAALIGGMSLHVVSEGLHGSTLGKRLCGIIVVDENGGPATIAGALKRNIAYFLDALFFGFVAARKMAESPRRQRIGDVWARTMVVPISTLDAASRPSTQRFVLVLLAALSADAFLIFLELAARLIA